MTMTIAAAAAAVMTTPATPPGEIQYPSSAPCGRPARQIPAVQLLEASRNSSSSAAKNVSPGGSKILPPLPVVRAHSITHQWPLCGRSTLAYLRRTAPNPGRWQQHRSIPSHAHYRQTAAASRR